MSQEKVTRYKEEKANRKQIMKKQKNSEIPSKKIPMHENHASGFSQPFVENPVCYLDKRSIGMVCAIFFAPSRLGWSLSGLA